MKKTFNLTRLLTALLMLCMLLACLFGTAVAEEFRGYIATIGLVAADTAEEAKQQLIDTGHVVVDVDLNEGTERGKRVYMGYTLTMDPTKAISDLKVRYDEYEINFSPLSVSSGYYLVGSSKEPNSAGGGIVDLNKNTSGLNFYAAPIHLYVYRDPACTPLTDIIVLNTDIVPDKYMEPKIRSTVVDGFAGTSFIPLDQLHLNYGAEGGSRLYMYIQQFRQIVPATILYVYYLSDTGDIQSYKAEKRFHNHTDTLSFDGVPQTVTFDGMSFTLEGWHDHWMDKGAPTITALTPEARFEALGSGVIRKHFYATYSHNLTMSFDALDGTGAPAALTQKQYLNVQSVDTKLERKFFRIPDTVPVHADPTKQFFAWNTEANGTGHVYHPGQTLTLSKDMTLYAMWTVNSSECTITLDNTYFIANQPVEKKPGVVVTHNGRTLTAGVDYTYGYSRNTAPGMGQVIVSFMGQYTGTAKAYFTIGEMTVSADALYDGYSNYRVPPVTGSSTRTVTLTAMVDGVDVTDETRWSIQGSNASQSTEGISVQGNQLIFTSGAAEGTSIAVTGEYKDGSGMCWISVDKAYLPLTNLAQYETQYNGLPQMPTVVVGDGTLVEGVDYVVTYLRNDVETDDFTNAGEIRVQVTGIGDYTGTQGNSYFIRSCPVSSAREEYIKELSYNGRPQKPQLTLMLDSGYQLREGVDYTLSYERAYGEPDDLTSIGTIYIYAAAVEGGNFNGQDMMSYMIVESRYDITSSISITAGSASYDGLPHPATVVVTCNGETLTEGRDYTVTYTRDGVETTDVTNIGTVQVEVKGKGNYIGSNKKIFDIYPYAIKPNMVTVSADTTWNGSSQKPTVSVSGVAETDYTVTFTRGGVETDDFTTCGTIAVKVKGVNNASGTVTKDYVINHHPDMACGHAGDFALKYQSEPGARPEYTNDLNYLNKEGIVTLQKPITLDQRLIGANDLTLVMNGQTITLTSADSYLYTSTGSLTIDATAGGSIVCGHTPAYWMCAIEQTEPLTIKGNLVLDSCWIVSISNDPIDLTEYTGNGLIIRTAHSRSAQKPSLPMGYELISWTLEDGDGEPIADGTLNGYNRCGKVVIRHEHAWTFTASGNVITATCANVGCTVPYGTATITLTNPENLTYDGHPKIVTIKQSPADTFPVLPTAHYLCQDSCTDVGVHTATLTYQGATAETSFTIHPMDITGATVGPFAEMTFNRAAQTPEATVTLGQRTVTGTWSSVTNVNDLTTFTANGNYTGTIADQATGMLKAKPTAADFVLAAPQNPVYDGHAKQASVYRAGSASGMGMFTPYYFPAGYSPDTYVSPTDAGEYFVGLFINEGDNFLAHTFFDEPLILGSFNIEPAQPVMTAETDITSYMYGDFIIVTGTVEVLQQDGNLVDFIDPEVHQVALYDDEGNQLCESVSLQSTGYFLLYDTSIKALKPGEDLTLTVKFTGDANIADQSAVTNTFTLEPAFAYPELTGAAAKVFDGTTDVPADHTLSLPLVGILDGDEVGVTGTFAYADCMAGTDKIINATNFELEGGDAVFYQLTVDIVSEPVGIITPAKLTGVEPPADKTLPSHCEYAEDVIAQLPEAVTFHVEGGSTVDINVRWFCETYDNTPSAVNTFSWEVDDADAMSCYEPDSTVAIAGSIHVRNSSRLPVTVIGTPATITYNGEPYDATALYTFDPNAGERYYFLLDGTTGEGWFEGSMLNIARTGNFNVGVSTAENGIYSSSITSAMLTVEKGTPNVAVPTDLMAHYTATLNMISLPSDENGTWSWDDPTAPVGDIGRRFHKAVYMPYNTGVWNTVGADVPVTVIRAATTFGDDVGVFNQGTATNSFTYGDTVTVKVKPVPAPAPLAMFSLRSRPAPQPGQMALYLRANGTDTQITDPVSADENGVYTMEYATTGKDLAIGENTLVAKYVGDESMADKEQEVDITLEPKELIIVTITAQSRAYEKGNDQVSVTGVELSGVESGDSVTVDTTGLTATLSGDDAALYGMAEVPLEPTLSGDDAGYYFLIGSVSVDVAQGGVEITKKQAVLLTASLYPNSFVYNGSEQKPTVTVTDGETLLTEGVDYVITWPANCIDVGEKAILITFIGNYSGTTALSYKIVESQIPLVIAKQPADQFVTEGERAEFSVEATGAGLTWQWYINRNDGRGWRAIDGAVTSTCVTSVTDAECDGFQYRCTVGDRYGSAVQSAAAVLHVTKIPVLPETGDASAPLLWLALSLLSVTGIACLRKKAHTR